MYDTRYSPLQFAQEGLLPGLFFDLTVVGCVVNLLAAPALLNILAVSLGFDLYG